MSRLPILLLGLCLCACATKPSSSPLPSAARASAPPLPMAMAISLQWTDAPGTGGIVGHNVYEKYWNGRTVTPWVRKATVTSGNTWSTSAGYGLHLWTVTTLTAAGESPRSNQVVAAAW